ncbi:hypothetical protein [Cryobacterium zhongshanensis]|uniref:Uncharacterized protein n=1 Tax=Cryobacterium zhongshanensis TaxID=2928153 RepID=A0AA41QY29_9MICO|nr:hypothetical protein [Cryobacterium zhongshanensis]MCI4659592.1 hypothetical protein [Cryobacterium zhongshanensis]
MSLQYTEAENDQWAESKRLENVRRIGMNLPMRPGAGTPPRPKPQSQSPKLPAHLGGPPISPPPGSMRNPIVRGRENAAPGTRANPNVKSGNEPGSLGNPLVRESAAQAAARQLPVKGLIDAQSMPGYQAPAQPVDQDSVVKASTQGFTNGFVGGLAGGTRPGAGDSTTKDAEADSAPGAAGVAGLDLPAGSPLSALAMVAEAAENAQSVDARMKRFPELENVKVLTGNAARFPELAEPPEPDPRPDTPEQEEDGGYQR